MRYRDRLALANDVLDGFQHCLTNPAFLVASLSPALITCTQPPEQLQQMGGGSEFRVGVKGRG